MVIELEARLQRQAPAATSAAAAAPSAAGTSNAAAPPRRSTSLAPGGGPSTAARTHRRSESAAPTVPTKARGAAALHTRRRSENRDPVGATAPPKPSHGGVASKKPVRKAWAAPRTLTGHAGPPGGSTDAAFTGAQPAYGGYNYNRRG